MELLTLPKLRLNQLQTVSEYCLEICSESTQLEVAVGNVNAQLILFKAGMTKEKASAADKKELDYDRDNLTLNFIKAVKAESNFPYEDTTTIDTINQVLKVINSYGTKVTRLSYNEESAGIDNLVSDLNKIDLTPLADSGLARWIPIIDDANTAFKDAVKEYIGDSVQSNLIDAASTVAPSLIDALDALFSMIYAYLKIEYSEELETAYSKIQILLNSYR